MAYTTADLTSVERAIASGVLTCVVNGQTVTYRSIKDLERARDLIRREIATSAGSGGRAVFHFQPVGRRD